MLIGQELEDRGIAALAAIGAALGMLAAEVTSLLTRHQLGALMARSASRRYLL
jgi:hypothetical protein